MKFIGLDNKEYNLDVRQNRHKVRTEEGCKSKLQYRCGQLIKNKYPLAPLLEEVSIPGHRFVFDFFLPFQKIVIEVDGSQHAEYNPFFYKSKREFIAAQHRDSDKESLCNVNNWVLIRVKSEDELKEILGD